MVLDRNNISYVLSYHSLLGSWLMHSLLPHDDTIQLLTRVSLSKPIANRTSSKRQSVSQPTPATPCLSWKQLQQDRLTGLLWNCAITTNIQLESMSPPEGVVLERESFILPLPRPALVELLASSTEGSDQVPPEDILEASV